MIQIGGLGEIKRTVANKREKRHSSDEEMVPKKSSRSVTEKEKGRAIYKTALNGNSEGLQLRWLEIKGIYDAFLTLFKPSQINLP